MKWAVNVMNVKVSQMLRPFNKGFSALQIKLVMNDLVYRYTQNVREKMKIRVFKEHDDYFVYAKIPSESNDEYPDSAPIHYDVIIQLIPPNKAAIAWDNIREYDAKVFSNIPSFVFTFNYVYHHKRALINLPSSYYTQRAILEKARVRNPLNLFGIDKSLWFTIYYLDEHRIFKRSNIDALVEDNLNLVTLLKDEVILTQDRKLDQCELREKHKRDLKEVENKKKRLATAKATAKNENVRSSEMLSLFSDLSSGLHSESFRAKALENKIGHENNTGINSGISKPKLHGNITGDLRSSLYRRR
jgi:hypothetical protein